MIFKNFNSQNKGCLITLFDILLIVVVLMFVKNYVSRMPYKSVKISDIQYKLNLKKVSYDNIELTLKLKNLSDSPKKIQFESEEGAPVKFIIQNAAQEEIKSFYIQGDTEILFQKAEEKVFKALFDRKDDDGIFLKDGKYFLTALIFSPSRPQLTVEFNL